jgi:branched-chain amino acid transport system permease protein
MKKYLPTLIGVVLFLLVLGQVESSFYLHMIILTGLSALTASTLNLLYGYAGQISLGHVAFYGTGAYLAAVLTTEHGWSPWLSLIVAPAFCFVLGGLIAIPAFRTAGIYFSIVTLSVGVLAHILMVNWISVTRGAQGLPGIPDLPVFSLFGAEIDLGDRKPYAILVWIVVLLWTGFLALLLRSRLGDGWIGIRENERLARSLGFPTYRLKVLANAIASGGVGLAGALLAHYMGIVSPASFASMESLMMLVVVVVGGAGRLWGPVLGAVVLTALPEWLRFADDLRLVLFGVILLLIVLYLPQGLMGGVDRIIALLGSLPKRLGRGRRTEPPATGDDGHHDTVPVGPSVEAR